MKEFYVKLRNSNKNENAPIPISPRQLEALMRLSQASAKIRLSNKVEEEDANRAIGLLTYSLSQVGIDPDTGELDIDMIQTGVPKSKRDKMELMLDIIKKVKAKYNEVNIEVLVEHLEEYKITEGETEKLLDRLHKEGCIFRPKNGFVSVI